MLITELQVRLHYTENTILSLAIRFILPCVAHQQLPVREAAVAAVTSIITIEPLCLFIRGFISEKLDQAEEKPPNVLEGALSLAIATCCEATIKPSCLAALLGNRSSSVRQLAAAVLGKETVSALVLRLLEIHSSCDATTAWQASESVLMALGAKLQEVLTKSELTSDVNEIALGAQQLNEFLVLISSLSNSKQFEIQRMAKQVSPMFLQFIVRNVSDFQLLDSTVWPEEHLGLLAWLLTVLKLSGRKATLPPQLLETRNAECVIVLFTYHSKPDAISSEALVAAWKEIFSNSSAVTDAERYLPDFCATFSGMDLLLPTIIDALQKSKCSHTQCHLLEGLKVCCLEPGCVHKLLLFAWDHDREPPTNKDGGDSIPRGIHWLRQVAQTAPIVTVGKGLDNPSFFISIVQSAQKLANRKDMDPCVVVRCWDLGALLFRRGLVTYDEMLCHVTGRLEALFPAWQSASPLPPSPSKASFDDSSDDEGVAGVSLQSELWHLTRWISRMVPEHSNLTSSIDVKAIFDKLDGV